MAIVTTMPKKGEAGKVYDIPDAELQKFQEVQATKATYDEGQSQIQGAEELGGALDLDKMDVQAYSDICICYFRWGRHVYYKYIYCWQSCP